MQIKLKTLIEIVSLKGRQFDLHEEFGVAHLVKEEERVTLYFNSLPCRAWANREHPLVEKIKWLDPNHVILYFDKSSAAIVSKENWSNIRVGFISKLFVSKNYIFVSYTDESFFESGPAKLESNIISVFSHEGHLQFGARELFDKDLDADPLYEIIAAYTCSDNIVFIGYDSKFVWFLNADRHTWKKVPFQFGEVGIKVLTGDSKAAYAIFDHRWSRDLYPDRPLFELAIFDLVSETSFKSSFAPVEAALTAAEFEMSEIKFQPNSTGRIIVSDSKKAALLEFSGLP